MNESKGCKEYPELMISELSEANLQEIISAIQNFNFGNFVGKIAGEDNIKQKKAVRGLRDELAGHLSEQTGCRFRAEKRTSKLNKDAAEGVRARALVLD